LNQSSQLHCVVSCNWPTQHTFAGLPEKGDMSQGAMFTFVMLCLHSLLPSMLTARMLAFRALLAQQ
jgi:hypothetical protein